MLSSNSEGLQRVQDLALRDKNLVFNNLLHHADLELFRFAFKQLRKEASTGVDQKTWEEYKGGSSKEDREEFDSKLANLRNVYSMARICRCQCEECTFRSRTETKQGHWVYWR